MTVMDKPELRGTTWAHTRAIAPLVAASQWFSDTRSGPPAVWSTHCARQFGEGPLESLAADFDLVCFDHPHVGHIADSGIFLPLEEHLSGLELAERAAASTGHSFSSYASDGHQWGVPVDAAGTMAAWNPAKLHARSLEVPDSWNALLQLASEWPDMVVQPFSRMTTTALFFSLSVSLSNRGPQRLDSASFAESVHRLDQLYRATHGGFGFQLGSIDVLKRAMQGSDPIALVPFAYPYSCFARTDLLDQALQFGPHPAMPDGSPWHGVLGGAGIAVSARSSLPKQATDLLRWLTSLECQSTFFGVCMGQPADRRAWSTPGLNHTTNDFYFKGLALLDAAWLRPTDASFHAAQSQLADVLHAYLAGVSPLAQTRAVVARLLARYSD